MLFASKRELHAGVALSILQVREQELAYYTANINNIGLQASLLAGFAFSTLSSHESLNVLTWIEQAPERPFLVISFDITAAQQVKVLLELLYLTSTISAMGSTLYTLYICLITSILGPGLALRGPEGSVDRAVIGLARVNRKVIQSFGFALDLFQFSILATTFLNFHLIAACICSFFVVYYMARIKKYTSKLTKEFLINKDLIVTGRFEDEGKGRAISAAEQHLFPTFVDTLQDAVSSVPRKAAALAARAQGKKAGTGKESLPQEFPSYVASNMMHHWQGPLPEEFEGELAAEEVEENEGVLTKWMGRLFGADAAKPAPLPPALREPQYSGDGPMSPGGSDGGALRSPGTPMLQNAYSCLPVGPSRRDLSQRSNGIVARRDLSQRSDGSMVGVGGNVPRPNRDLRDMSQRSDGLAVVARRDLSQRSEVSQFSEGSYGQLRGATPPVQRAKSIGQYARNRIEL